ncbi:MAG: type II toxin-antitoxin system VapC family toxin [Acidobacteria bacterium]|nr:type II toxin-antitoxin system VapC family toxin [Acidobacteriota bacterium]
MKPKVYVETTVVSYLTAFPSRDLLLAAHQQVTRDWWAGRAAFSLFVSQFVWDEASAGAAAAAERRLAVLRELPFLDLTNETTTLAAELLRLGGVPQAAKIDALHIAVAAAHGMDYLVSWNCTHIANATMRGRIETICRAAGFIPPLICTPLELAKEQAP